MKIKTDQKRKKTNGISNETSEMINDDVNGV